MAYAQESKRAFTLVELMLALALAAIVGLAITGVYLLGSRTYSVAKQKQVVMENTRACLEQMAEFIKWGGYHPPAPNDTIAGIYWCTNLGMDCDNTGPVCFPSEYGTGLGIITDVYDGGAAAPNRRRVNFFFQSDATTPYTHDANLVMEVRDTANALISSQVMSDRVLMPGSPLPTNPANPDTAFNNDSAQNAPLFCEFYDSGGNLLTDSAFPLSTTAFPGICVKLSLTGVNWESTRTNSVGANLLVDPVSTTYTITIYTRNYGL